MPRRSVAAVVSCLCVSLLLAFVAPAFGQAPAAVPAPKVTITGLVDFVASVYNNWSGGGDSRRPFEWDVTDGGKDKGAYTRERGVFTITGEVGRSKGVWAVELDFTNGAGVGVTSRAAPGTSANFDLDTDVAGQVETKWLYVETPLTGPGSILPFIPVSTVIRGGGQPFRGHDYKVGIHASGDFPGVTLETSWAPNLKTTLTYVQIGEALDEVLNFFGAGRPDSESYAILASVEYEVFKGLTVKPTYSYAHYSGGNCGTANLGIAGVGGFNPNACVTSNAVVAIPGAPTFPLVAVGLVPPALPFVQTNRHTLGGDVRWTAGPFTLQPTAYIQFGEQELQAGIGGARVTRDVDIWTWIVDVIGGYRVGPLNFEARAMYTPGMKAQHQVQNGADVGYYQPINSGFSYMSGWTEIWTGGVDYATALNVGNAAMVLRESPSYDKYGRVFLGLAADYSLTPALSFTGLANVSWTAEKVDNSGAPPVGLTATGSPGIVPFDNRGDARYLGTEVASRLTYRFAPNVVFDLGAGYLFVGEALDHARTVGGPVKDADDVWKLSARVRMTF